MSENAPPLQPVARIKFDRWAFDHGLDNVALGRRLGAHPVVVGRWRRPYDHRLRRIPQPEIIHRIEQLSGGAVRPEDWYRPCEVKYLPPLPQGQPQAVTEDSGANR